MSVTVRYSNTDTPNTAAVVAATVLSKPYYLIISVKGVMILNDQQIAQPSLTSSISQ